MKGWEVMREGLKIGDSAKITAKVTKEMFAQFGGEVVHPVYSTAWMVYHMEWAARKLLVPVLEADEEGMGAAVTVKHIAPSGLGTNIAVTATVTAIRDRLLITKVLARNEGGIIGEGEVKQAILPKNTIDANVKKATPT